MTEPPPRGRAFLSAVVVAALAWGGAAAWHYHRIGLTLTHYDARGHLVVARRIFDSITPGWQQIGAVWLPLPHLLNAIPVQIDLFYRTGASAVAISIVSFAAATAAIAWIVQMVTGSIPAALAAALVFAANPNVLYLQATPMTEPLLLAFTTAAVGLLLADTTAAGGAARRAEPASPLARGSISAAFVGAAFALACLTRYEAWPVTGAALACAVWARWRGGEPFAPAVRHVARIALYPAATIVAFMIFSRIVVGEWFVASGFFVPENSALGHPLEAVKQIVWGTRALSGLVLVIAAGAGLAVLAAGLFDRRRAPTLIAASLLATAAVSWLAFFKGHPYRIRYMVPLIAIEAAAAGIAADAVGRPLRRARPLGAVALALIALFELHPFDANAPMVVEAQWDRPNIVARQPVADFLRAHYDGTSVMASMGSLGHYMQQLSRAGFSLRDFLHEGNGDIWLSALDNPRPYAGWILVEEKAEGGDMLAVKAREQPAFLTGYSRVAEGAGLALYRRGEATAAAGEDR